VSELGQVLQKAREEKGISLDDIQRVTKIQRRYLEAIERGHFHLLPGHFYARAFIKSYAEAVGLDPSHLLNHFQADLPAQQPQEQVERLRRRRAAAVNDPLQAGRWVTKTLLVLFVVLIIGVIYMAFVNSTGLDTSPTPGTDSASPPGVQAGTPLVPPAAPPAPAPVQTPEPTSQQAPAEEEKATLTFESQQGSVYTFVLSPADKITVKVKANDRCWFEVREAPKKKGDGVMLKKGDEKVLEAPKNPTLVVGAPTAVQISVNDVPIDMSKIKFFPSLITIKPKQP
jgi:cytoskeletal protein RodZ